MKRNASRLRRTLAVAIAVSAVGPFLAQQRAEAQIVGVVERCVGESGACGGVRAVRLDARGLSMDGVWRRAGGRIWRARAITIAPTWNGVQIDVWGLRHEPAHSPERRMAIERGEPERASSETASSGPVVVPNRGVPVSVRLHDPVEFEAAGVHLDVQDLVLDVAADGSVLGQGVAAAQIRGHSIESTGPVTVRPLSLRPPAIAFDGAFVADELKTPVPVTGTLCRETSHVVIGLPGSTLRLDATRGDRDAGERLHLDIDADHFGLAVAWPLLAAHAPIERFAIAPDVTVDGSLELVVADDFRVHFDEVAVRGLSLQHAKLARSRVDFDELVLDGDAWWRGQRTYDAQLTVAHRGITAHATGVRRGDEIEAHVELAQMSCQQFLDSIPDALTDVVRGTRLKGDIDGRVGVQVSLSELERIRGLSEVDIDPLDPPRPGKLDFEFDFLERCKVTDDAPGIDLAALTGPYQHRFVDGRGRNRQRAMAVGAPGFITLSRASGMADAFIVLEDTRYFEHDGFDRDQMLNAWWHNLVVGRISRGASTISQQAARNLFLGVDRSLGRKMQEAFVTARLEQTLTKRRILELYLNVIELAPGVHGVDDASRFYFGKPASDLDVLQAIHLASLAPAPHTYAERFADGTVDEAWMANLRDQAQRMYRHHKIDRAELRRALAAQQAEKLGLLDRTPSNAGE